MPWVNRKGSLTPNGENFSRKSLRTENHGCKLKRDDAPRKEEVDGDGDGSWHVVAVAAKERTHGEGLAVEKVEWDLTIHAISR